MRYGNQLNIKMGKNTIAYSYRFGCTVVHAFYRSHSPYHTFSRSGHSFYCIGMQSRLPSRIPLNLSWNQFINYHIIKFKYKYYMVSYYVFGIAVNSTAYCIIHLTVHSLRTHYDVVQAGYHCNNILNGKLCGLLSMNHENDQFKFIWILSGNSIAIHCFLLCPITIEPLSQQCISH